MFYFSVELFSKPELLSVTTFSSTSVSVPGFPYPGQVLFSRPNFTVLTPYDCRQGLNLSLKLSFFILYTTTFMRTLL